MSVLCTSPIEFLTLSRGNHDPSSGQYCAVEAAVCRFTKGAKHSDRAEDCNASPGIARGLIRLNDRWGDARRQKLKIFVDRLPNTKGTPEQERTRAYIAADWAVRELLPMLCDELGANAWADEIRSLSAIVDEATAAEGQSWAYFFRDYADADAAYAAAATAYATAYAAADAADAAYAAADADAAYAAYAADADERIEARVMVLPVSNECAEPA